MGQKKHFSLLNNILNNKAFVENIREAGRNEMREQLNEAVARAEALARAAEARADAAEAREQQARMEYLQAIANQVAPHHQNAQQDEQPNEK